MIHFREWVSSPGRVVHRFGYRLLLLAAMAGCLWGCGADVGTDTANLEVKTDTLEVIGARAVPLPGGESGVVYLTVENGTEEPDRLLALETPVAEVVETHETVDENGILRMVPRPEGFEIPARSKLELKPGGKHVMLHGMRSPLEAEETILLKLHFERFGIVELTVPVEDFIQG